MGHPLSCQAESLVLARGRVEVVQRVHEQRALPVFFLATLAREVVLLFGVGAHVEEHGVVVATGRVRAPAPDRALGVGEELAEAGEFLPYTESPVWRWSTYATGRHDDPMLFDVSADPEQEDDLAGADTEQEERMRSLLVDALDHLDAPASQYERLGLAR